MATRAKRQGAQRDLPHRGLGPCRSDVAGRRLPEVGDEEPAEMALAHTGAGSEASDRCPHLSSSADVSVLRDVSLGVLHSHSER